MADTDISQTPFIKNLGSSDRRLRDSALTSLTTFLSGRRPLPPLSSLKLWKGLFYALWMTDRPLPQQAMCTSLASLISTIHAPNRAEFVRGFWMTMKREWTNIDVLRMEKFLLLTRRVVAAQFAICADAEWAQEVVEEQLGLLVETPLDCEDVRVPMGLRYHVIDVYVDELERAGALGEERRGVELEVLLGPLRELKGRSPTRSVREKAAEALGDERLPGNEKEDVEMEDEGWGGIED